MDENSCNDWAAQPQIVVDICIAFACPTALLFFYNHYQHRKDGRASDKGYYCYPGGLSCFPRCPGSSDATNLPNVIMSTSVAPSLLLLCTLLYFLYGTSTTSFSVVLVIYILFEFFRTIPWGVFTCFFALKAQHRLGILIAISNFLLTFTFFLVVIYDGLSEPETAQRGRTSEGVLYSYRYLDANGSSPEIQFAVLIILPCIIPCLYILYVNSYQTSYFRSSSLNHSDYRRVISYAKGLRIISMIKILLLLTRLMLLLSSITSDLPSLCNSDALVRGIGTTITEGFIDFLVLYWQKRCYTDLEMHNQMVEEMERGVSSRGTETEVRGGVSADYRMLCGGDEDLRETIFRRTKSTESYRPINPKMKFERLKNRYVLGS